MKITKRIDREIVKLIKFKNIKLVREYIDSLKIINKLVLKKNCSSDDLIFFEKEIDYYTLDNIRYNKNNNNVRKKKDKPQKKKSRNYCYMEICSSLGGEDSSFCVDILYRQYKYFFKVLKFSFNTIKKKKNKIGIYKYLLIKIKGKESYNLIKDEIGINKFIRKSKTKKSEIIHTSTCNVNIFPIKEKNYVEINKKDLLISTFKASGAGGQHVNKTNSAVRVKHIPTGIVAKSSSRRSQYMNKKNAIDVINFKINKTVFKKSRIVLKKFIRTFFLDKNILVDNRIKKKFIIDKLSKNNVLYKSIMLRNEKNYR
ncbi:peptide chain release factor-like protein [Candidatus Vidania fulgoroideorum]